MVNHPGHVVVSAEDDPDDRLLIQDAVLAIDPSFHLDFVQHGKELLEYLNSRRTKEGFRNSPYLILLDLNMPLMDGREALKRIKSDDCFKKLPVVVLTTSSEESDREICSELGAADFVSKPASFEDLVTVLKDVFSRWSPKPV